MVQLVGGYTKLNCGGKVKRCSDKSIFSIINDGSITIDELVDRAAAQFGLGD